MDTSRAPGELELVRAFVNTLELDEAVDELASPGALTGWLRAQGLLRGGAATRADLANARRLREALRVLLLANNGVSVRKEAAVTLNRAARRAGLGVRFEPEGTARVEPEARGVDGALGRLLAIVSAAMADGSWGRLKACRAEDCRWAFYDRARNRSRHWCSMAVCGNRTKARTFRRRHAA
ncbi:MAG: CGNR zinc finger domain-containing protein [Gaiellaceae bacterium]